MTRPQFDTPVVDCGAAHGVCSPWFFSHSLCGIFVLMSESSLTSMSAFQHTWSNLLFLPLVVFGITRGTIHSNFMNVLFSIFAIGFSSVLVELVANPIFLSFAIECKSLDHSMLLQAPISKSLGSTRDNQKRQPIT
jgi:hypothetical protein